MKASRHGWYMAGCSFFKKYFFYAIYHSIYYSTIIYQYYKASILPSRHLDTKDA